MFCHIFALSYVKQNHHKMNLGVPSPIAERVKTHGYRKLEIFVKILKMLGLKSNPQLATRKC